MPRDQYTAVFAPAVKDGHIVTVLKARLLRSRRLARKVLLAAATLLLLTIAAVVVLAVAIATLFRAGRLYAEVMAKWLSRAVLWMWGVRLAVHQDQPFPETQAVYMSNHSSTLDMFVMIALGLPNTRFVGAEDLGGFLRWMAPLGIISYVMGTLWAPPWSKPADRARWFQRTEGLLRRTGGSVYLSPEGERVTTGRLGPSTRTISNSRLTSARRSCLSTSTSRARSIPEGGSTLSRERSMCTCNRRSRRTAGRSRTSNRIPRWCATSS